MSDKLKKSTGGKLLLRSGGLALSLPLVIGLGGILILVNLMLTVLIVGGLLTGDAVVTPYISWLTLFLVLGLGTMVVLIRSVFRYTGGIGKLWSRLQGIHEERERVDRLIDKQTTTDDTHFLHDLDDQQQQTKHQ